VRRPGRPGAHHVAAWEHPAQGNDGKGRLRVPHGRLRRERLTGHERPRIDHGHRRPTSWKALTQARGGAQADEPTADETDAPGLTICHGKLVPRTTGGYAAPGRALPRWRLKPDRSDIGHEYAFLPRT
jgi:hypothetical protein